MKLRWHIIVSDLGLCSSVTSWVGHWTGPSRKLADGEGVTSCKNSPFLILRFLLLLKILHLCCFPSHLHFVSKNKNSSIPRSLKVFKTIDLQHSDQFLSHESTVVRLPCSPHQHRAAIRGCLGQPPKEDVGRYVPCRIGRRLPSPAPGTQG